MNERTHGDAEVPLWPEEIAAEEADNIIKWSKSPFRRCRCGHRPACPDCWRLYGARTDRESDEVYKELVRTYAPKEEAPDDKDLPEKFLLRLAHEFAKDPAFWKPFFLRVLQAGGPVA